MTPFNFRCCLKFNLDKGKFGKFINDKGVFFLNKVLRHYPPNLLTGNVLILPFKKF